MTTVKIIGTPRAGYTLTAVVDPATSGTFTWTGNGTAAGDTYVVDAADAGQTVEVAFSYPWRNNRERTEQASINILPLETNDPNGDFRIRRGNLPAGGTGFSVVENSLPDRDNFEASPKTYTWSLDGVTIPGATSDAYETTQSDQGKEIQLRIDYVDGLGNPKYIASRVQTV
ncbi:MAG: hypothetical protein MI867_19740 [Pseudomonadales bacterium]|nr:hypothetical protein [Pseudomonadales bacterium]